MSSAEITTYPGAFWRLYASEARLVLGRRRNQALLVALAAIPLFIGIAIYVSPPTRPGDGPPFLGQISGNGLFLVFTALSVCTPLFLPLTIGVVSGDSIAGEAGLGTLRYLLTLPVTRTRLLVAKTLGTLTFTLAALLAVTLTGLVAGGLLFGWHDVTLLSGDSVGIGNGIGRAFLVAAFLFGALAGLASIGVFVSTMTENAIAAMATTVGLAVLSFVLDSVPQLKAIHPVLLTHNWLGFGEFLRQQVDGAALLRWTGLHLSYAAIFLSLAYARLGTKDVTS
jgi:ABC-2 type transport system permease protein